jgi:hypothetical protein
MVWIRDIFSPSNLWTAFTFLFPAATAVLSSWLSWLAGLPLSVSLGLALISAACAVILFDAARGWFVTRNSQSQRIKELEARLTPKIKILGLHERVDPIVGRTFELEIKNDSDAYLQDCLAKITAISLFKTRYADRLFRAL